MLGYKLYDYDGKYFTSCFSGPDEFKCTIGEHLILEDTGDEDSFFYCCNSIEELLYYCLHMKEGYNNDEYIDIIGNSLDSLSKRVIVEVEYTPCENSPAYEYGGEIWSHDQKVVRIMKRPKRQGRVKKSYIHTKGISDAVLAYDPEDGIVMMAREGLRVDLTKENLLELLSMMP